MTKDTPYMKNNSRLVQLEIQECLENERGGGRERDREEDRDMEGEIGRE